MLNAIYFRNYIVSTTTTNPERLKRRAVEKEVKKAIWPQTLQERFSCLIILHT